MLSRHSFNALLKRFEEPPAHVKFLLATTDPAEAAGDRFVALPASSSQRWMLNRFAISLSSIFSMRNISLTNPARCSCYHVRLTACAMH